MRTIRLALSLLVLATAPAVAGTPVDETRPASRDGAISIEMISGTLKVVGWDRNEMKLTGVLADDVENLKIGGGADSLSVEVIPRKHSSRRGGAGTQIEIRVPFDARIAVEVVAVTVSLEGLRGAVEAEAVSGEITMSGAFEEATASLVSGNLTFRSDRPLRRGEFQTVSGRLDITTSLAKAARLTVEAFSGDVVLRLPADVSATFDVSTFSGGIENGFGSGEIRKSAVVPAKNLSFSVGSGDARVNIDAFSGHVRLLER